MTKYSALPIKQKGLEFYVVIADPRIICKVTKFANEKETQEYQRPWKKKKVVEIAKLVGGEMNIREGAKREEDKVYATGLIPNCPIIHLLDANLLKEEDGKYYLNIENTDKILFDVPIDGQHRLLSFREDFCRIGDGEEYQMAFIVFKNLTLAMINELFYICNDKQESVPKDVTLNQKMAMGLLTDEKERLYSYVIALNEETISPYKGRVKINGENITRGLSPDAMIRSLYDSDFTAKFTKIDKQREKLLLYLSSWRAIFNEELMNLSHPLSKSNGFRFIMKELSYVHQVLFEQKKTWINKDIEPVLVQLKSIAEEKDIFNPGKGNFSAQTATDVIAKEVGEQLLSETRSEEYEL